MADRRLSVTHWLRGSASVSPYGKNYVRLWMERPGLTAEIYLTTKQARELRESLDWLLTAPTAKEPTA